MNKSTKNEEEVVSNVEKNEELDEEIDFSAEIEMLKIRQKSSQNLENGENGAHFDLKNAQNPNFNQLRAKNTKPKSDSNSTRSITI
jgi:hypothetical protein